MRGAHNTGTEQPPQTRRPPEQLESLRVALQEIAEDRVPTTYGGGARAMRVRANHALSDLSNPASEPLSDRERQERDEEIWPKHGGRPV